MHTVDTQEESAHSNRLYAVQQYEWYHTPAEPLLHSVDGAAKEALGPEFRQSRANLRGVAVGSHAGKPSIGGGVDGLGQTTQNEENMRTLLCMQRMDCYIT